MSVPPDVESHDVNHFTTCISRVIAGCFGLAAFGIALVTGLASENPATIILTRAIFAMVVCYPIGWIVGLLCQRIIDDHIKAHKQANPAIDSLEEYPVEVNLESSQDSDDEEEILVV
ncbi:MAG: hypothetical protein O7G85_14250 [Planctomycetota bacterium]|nr:hypothetical protein [Planctomycetota bacterium]